MLRFFDIALEYIYVVSSSTTYTIMVVINNIDGLVQDRSNSSALAVE